MWNAASDNIQLKHVALEAGSLLVTRRTYVNDGIEAAYPGHIGIVTKVSDGSISFIHASASAGKVEERPLKTLRTIMGSIVFTNI